MDRMWRSCQILLFLTVLTETSLREEEETTSCDGAFDIYFVLDR